MNAFICLIKSYNKNIASYQYLNEVLIDIINEGDVFLIQIKCGIGSSIKQQHYFYS